MKQIFIILLCIVCIPLYAQKTKKTNKKQKRAKVQKVEKADINSAYQAQLSVLVSKSVDFLEANKLTKEQSKKMLNDTFRAIADGTDFVKALDQYFEGQYDKDFVEILYPYYNNNLSIVQLDTLIHFADAEKLKCTTTALAKCDEASYRDILVDQTLDASGMKPKAKKKIKKNMKKFVSDCSDEYRAILKTYATAAGVKEMSEDMVNAIYHTVSIEDLKAYTAYLSSPALAGLCKTQQTIVDDIYTVKSSIVSSFQTWTYTAFPSIFTKKQVQSGKKKGKKGKQNATQQNDDVIIEGGVIY